MSQSYVLSTQESLLKTPAVGSLAGLVQSGLIPQNLFI